MPEKLQKELISDVEAQSTLEKIDNLPKGKRVALVVHKNPPPDPDALDSSLALCEMLDARNIKADIFASGTIGNPQNIAIMNHFGITLQDEKFWEKYKSNYGLVILCDCGINNASINAVPDIIIDHHHENAICEGCLVIKKRVGANATIVYYLLKKMGFEFVHPSPIATALAIAIEIDTKGLTKVDEIAEFNFDDQALRELLPLGNYADFKRLTEHYELTKSYYKALGMDTEKIFTGCLALHSVGDIREKQTYCVPLIADLLLRNEQTRLAVVIGIVDGQYIRASVRTDFDSIVQINEFCKQVFDDDATKISQGARPGSGGAEIPLSTREQEEWACANPEQKKVLIEVKLQLYRRRIEKILPDA